MRRSLVTTPKESKRISLLPEISKTDPCYQPLKVYFFGTPQSITLALSKNYQVHQIITHVLALGDTDLRVKMLLTQGLAEQMRDSYRSPELYEMRLLEDEDDEEAYTPLYETGPLDKEGIIGAFLLEKAVLCRKKEYEGNTEQGIIINKV